MSAKTYEEWKQEALRADQKSGAEEWKCEEQSDLYDYKVIRRRYDELVSVRASGNIHDLLFYLNEGIHGNMGGMGAPNLYTKCEFGTKKLIADYVDEIVAALEQLDAADEKDLSQTEKQEVFQRASLCYGRSALMLSGAGSQGPFHIGVVKALSEQKLLSNIISGASAGAIIAAIIGSSSKTALHRKLESSELIDAFQVMCAAENLLQPQRSSPLDDLIGLIETLVPDMTFAESFEESGRYINVSVAPTEIKQRSRLLNAITSPNALLREAILASCAVPGVFPPVALAAKDRNGQRKPYVPTRKWRDGSITNDLPTRRLSRLYSVNHFISSQTNPLVLWALPDPQKADDPWTRLMSVYQSAGREWLRAVYPIAMDMMPASHPQNVNLRMLFDIMTQEYTADITILPKRKNAHLGPLLSAATSYEARAMVFDGEASTWPRIEQIRINTIVSRKLDEIIQRNSQAGQLSPLATAFN